MPSFTKSHAEATVKKLRRKTGQGIGPFTVKERTGGKHRIIQVYHSGQFIFAFGIKNGSRMNAGHAWVHEQIGLTRSEGLDFANCPLSVEDLVTLLRDRGVIAQS